ncbi:unnamed protein product [Prunus armeniaca]
MHQDSTEYVQRCDQCQRYKLIPDLPVNNYLVNENLPNDKFEARKIKQKAARYYMNDNMLVRRSYSGPHLTCIKYPQTLQVLCKIHKGECKNHTGGRSLA